MGPDQLVPEHLYTTAGMSDISDHALHPIVISQMRNTLWNEAVIMVLEAHPFM